VSDAAQLVLFAPYCGGVSREQDLSAALQILSCGELKGRRPVAGIDGYLFELRWNGVAAPMERLNCQLRFPGHPEGDVDFAVTTHQLVAWLMDRSHLHPSEPDLPDGFWQWLLMERGDAPEQA
jgi:hypothetical protein